MADTVTTIGERLEEARKRKGISIREAAEATKVRGDFLIAMESNTFDINLPEVYVRGFLKIYINFLRLDLERMMADYDAMRLGGRKGQHRLGAPGQRGKEGAAQPQQPEMQVQSSRVSFGRMDMGEGPALNESPGPVLEPRSPLDGMVGYLRPAIIISAVVLGIVLVGLLVSSIYGGKKPEINPELARNNPSMTTPASSRPVTLIASDAVLVWVIRKSDNARVFEGTLTPGETRIVEVDGPAEVRYNKGENLKIQRDGQLQSTNKSGGGKSIIP